MDAGNALYGSQPLTLQSKGKIIIDAMNLMRYDAMAIGEQDVLLGLDVLRQRIADAQFPVLSANLTLAGSGELVTRPYALLDVGGRKVGIIGLTGELSPQPSQEQFALLKAEDVLAKYVAELSSQTNIIVVLSNMGFEEDQRLSSMVPGIDLFVGGRSRIPINEAWRNEQTGTLVVQAGSRGEWLGQRRLHLDSAGIVTSYADELIYLTPDYADDVEMRSFLDNYKVQ